MCTIPKFSLPRLGCKPLLNTAPNITQRRRTYFLSDLTYLYTIANKSSGLFYINDGDKQPVPV